MNNETRYHCTLPECECGEFKAGKTQLKTCDDCKHGWIAHDLITEAQAKKIRKRGTKDGTPCQAGSCACGNYQRPPGVSKTSWLAVCENCKHSETEHRYPTKLDKLKKHNQERAADHACVGCEAECSSFQPSDDCTQSESQAPRKCATCRHVIETHRQPTSLDHFIWEELEACTSLRCHSIQQPTNKQARSSNWHHDVDNNAFLDAWLEPTNIDRDEDVPFLDANVCQCKGFVYDDMARICNQYFGFIESIVGPHLPNLACQQCSHALKYHRHHNEKEMEQLACRKQNNLTAVGVISVDAQSYSGYPNNVTFTMHPDEDNTATQNIMLAGTNAQKADRDADGRDMISVSSTKFCHLGSHGNHRLHSTSSGHDEESQSDDEKENEVAQAAMTPGVSGKKRGRKMSRIMDDVKRKIKRRKLGSKSKTITSGSESDAIEDEDPVGMMSRSLSKLGEETARISGHDSWVTALSWSHHASNQLAVMRDDRSLKIYQTSNEVIAEDYLPDGIGWGTCLSWSHCGKWIVSGHTCGTSVLWHFTGIPAGTMESSIIMQSSGRSVVTSISVSLDDRLISVGHQDSEVLIFDIKKVPGGGLDQAPIPCPRLLSKCAILYGAVLSLAWHPCKLLLVAGGEDDQVTVFFMKKPASHTSKGTLKHFFTRSPRRPTKKGFHQCAILKGHKSFVGALAFNSSGTFLVSAGWDGQLLFWNMADIDDAIESEDDVNSEVVCSSGYVMGRAARSQGLSEMPRPFEPRDITIFNSFLILMLRTSVNRVSLVLYEIPHKYLESSAKAEQCYEEN